MSLAASVCMSHPSPSAVLSTQGMTYRDLFDLIIVQARKPVFFKENSPLFQIVTEDGLMRPVMGMSPAGLQPAGSSGGAVARNSVPEHRLVRGRVFCGGSARMVEEYLGLRGDDIMYVGDHIYTDNALAKLNMRWRTALIIRELEEEVRAGATSGGEMEGMAWWGGL